MCRVETIDSLSPGAHARTRFTYEVATLPMTTQSQHVESTRLESLVAQRAVLLERVQAMLDTPEDERPKAKTALRAWLAELDSCRRMLEQLDKLVRMLERGAQRRRKAVVAATPAPASSPEESDAVVLALIPKGPRAELRVVVKTWRGRRVFDVRCWALRKDTGEYGPTRKGVTVDAKMLPALVEALQLALKNG